MSHPYGSTDATINLRSSERSGSLLHGRARSLMRACVGIVALLSLWTFMTRLPSYLLHLQTICTGSPCPYGQLTYASVAALHSLGLSLGMYAAFQITLLLLWTVLSLSLAALIFWRRSDDWMALLVVMLMVLWPTGLVTGAFSLGTYLAPEGFQFPAPLVNLLIRFGFFLVFALFPPGRFVSRWTLLPLGVLLLLEFSYHFLHSWPLESGWPNTFAELVWFVALLSLIPIQRYRYRYLSSAIERQQIKWAALGISIVTVAFVARAIPSVLIAGLNQPNSLYASVSTSILLFISLMIPLSIGLAILRYRLWDVDVLINKALVYGILSGTLATLYFGLIIGLQSALGHLIVQTSQPYVIVVSTLVIAALFQPLRSRIQQLIDRRFYRKKYDAAKTVAAFSMALRDEVDLEQLKAQLLAVVTDTMQPTHVSLWLSKQERTRLVPSQAADTNESTREHVMDQSEP